MAPSHRRCKEQIHDVGGVVGDQHAQASLGIVTFRGDGGGFRWESGGESSRSDCVAPLPMVTIPRFKFFGRAGILRGRCCLCRSASCRCSLREPMEMFGQPVPRPDEPMPPVRDAFCHAKRTVAAATRRNRNVQRFRCSRDGGVTVASVWRMTSLNASTLSASVSVAPEARKRLPFVCVRPPKLKSGTREKAEIIVGENAELKHRDPDRLGCALQRNFLPVTVRALVMIVYSVAIAVMPW